LSSCAYFSSFQVLSQVIFILFSILITVRILIILGDVFENKNCIFVISIVLGLYVSVVFWTVLCFLLDVICGKVHFTVAIMPDFLLELTRI
jgi:hypothetical protein